MLWALPTPSGIAAAAAAAAPFAKVDAVSSVATTTQLASCVNHKLCL